MEIEKYSIGIGDRFSMEGAAQLRALQKAETQGVLIVPVWNKSNREHSIIGTSPVDTRREADEAVALCGWKHSYYVDADHIGLGTVGRFLDSSNFFTIDVADSIGKPSAPERVASFLKSASRFKGALRVPGVQKSVDVTDGLLSEIARKYLRAVEEAGAVYRHIAGHKGLETFVTEVSADEAELPQSPAELFFILAALAWEKVPVQTIAPKFTGAFLKGIDYVGEVRQFAREFEDDLAIIAHAVKAFGLPQQLKLSIHSGSDKFSIYPSIHNALARTGAGLHIKTAGTTWLEEVIGLAEADGDGLAMAKEIYAASFKRYDELSGPYRAVINIDRRGLPDPQQVSRWSSSEFAETLRHDPSNSRFSRDFRQLVHIGYKVAAELDGEFTDLVRRCRPSIEANVTTNIFSRHIQPLFLGPRGAGNRP